MLFDSQRQFEQRKVDKSSSLRSTSTSSMRERRREREFVKRDRRPGQRVSADPTNSSHKQVCIFIIHTHQLYIPIQCTWNVRLKNFVAVRLALKWQN